MLRSVDPSRFFYLEPPVLAMADALKRQRQKLTELKKFTDESVRDIGFWVNPINWLKATQETFFPLKGNKDQTQLPLLGGILDYISDWLGLVRIYLLPLKMGLVEHILALDIVGVIRLLLMQGLWACKLLELGWYDPTKIKDFATTWESFRDEWKEKLPTLGYGLVAYPAITVAVLATLGIVSPIVAPFAFAVFVGVYLVKWGVEMFKLQCDLKKAKAELNTVKEEGIEAISKLVEERVESLENLEKKEITLITTDTDTDTDTDTAAGCLCIVKEIQGIIQKYKEESQALKSDIENPPQGKKFLYKDAINNYITRQKGLVEKLKEQCKRIQALLEQEKKDRQKALENNLYYKEQQVEKNKKISNLNTQISDLDNNIKILTNNDNNDASSDKKNQVIKVIKKYSLLDPPDIKQLEGLFSQNEENLKVKNIIEIKIQDTDNIETITSTKDIFVQNITDIAKIINKCTQSTNPFLEELRTNGFQYFLNAIIATITRDHIEKNHTPEVKKTIIIEHLKVLNTKFREAETKYQDQVEKINRLIKKATQKAEETKKTEQDKQNQLEKPSWLEEGPAGVFLTKLQIAINKLENNCNNLKLEAKKGYQEFKKQAQDTVKSTERLEKVQNAVNDKWALGIFFALTACSVACGIVATLAGATGNPILAAPFTICAAVLALTATCWLLAYIYLPPLVETMQKKYTERQSKKQTLGLATVGMFNNKQEDKKNNNFEALIINKV